MSDSETTSSYESSSETESELSSQGESSSESSESMEPDFYSQVSLEVIYADSTINLIYLLDMCRPDALYTEAVKLITVDTSGEFAGVEVSGKEFEVRGKTCFTASFTRQGEPQDREVIDAWEEGVYARIKEALTVIRVDGPKIKYLDPLEFEVF